MIEPEHDMSDMDERRSNKITEEMARKLYQFLPAEAEISIETTTNHVWVTDGSGSGFFVSVKAMTDYSPERLRNELAYAWQALRNGADKDEHGVPIITPLELEQHHVNRVLVPREAGGEAAPYAPF